MLTEAEKLELARAFTGDPDPVTMMYPGGTILPVTMVDIANSSPTYPLYAHLFDVPGMAPLRVKITCGQGTVLGNGFHTVDVELIDHMDRYIWRRAPLFLLRSMLPGFVPT